MIELIILAILSMENYDEQKFIEDLYVQYFYLMRKKVLEHINNNQYVEDIIHDACIKLIEKSSLLKTLEPNVLIAYVISTIENTTWNFIRRYKIKSKRIITFENSDDDVDDVILMADTETPEKLFFDKIDMQKIHNTVNKLPDKFRALLELKYFQNMSDKDIAEILGITQESVRQYLTRARRKAYKILEREPDLNE